jgi:hypothetical protein
MFAMWKERRGKFRICPIILGKIGKIRYGLAWVVIYHQ